MLHLHRSERADGLVSMLGELVADPLDDAMAAEVVAVPTRGIERWLTQQLSGRLGVSAGRADGVCANIGFPFPGTLVGGALAAASGVDPDKDPWVPEHSVWPLLEVVDTHLGEPWLAPLAAHLRNAAPQGETRRFAAVRHVADLYDRYGVHRPQLVRAWAARPAGQEVADAGWQAKLWCGLRDRIGVPSPSERLVEACGRLRAEPGLAELPPRLSLFGLTRLPASYLDVLEALAAERDVHLFLLHPSPALWEQIAGRVPGGGAGAGRRTPGRRRAEDPTAESARHPLLASWGRDARETQLVLAAAGDQPIDHHRPVEEEPTTLLRRLQADIRADRPTPGIPFPDQPDGRALLDDGDRSIQVHACHGRPRQIEVLRDAVLHLLEEDPTLEPRHIIVMCPDIETYAPLIHATFASYDDDPEAPADAAMEPGTGLPDLRVRLADRSLRQTNPVLGAVAEVLDLCTARITGSQVLDLAGREPVRRRFQLSEDDLTRLEEWIVAAGIRWGLDAGHRAPFKLDGLEANTWRAGLDRILLGVAMADERQRRLGDVLPLDDVDSGDVELAGRIAELLDRLEAAVTALAGTKPIAEWAAAIATMADSLTATSDRDAWQRAQLQRLLDRVVDEAAAGTGSAGSAVALGLEDVRAVLADRLRGQPTRANFRTGDLTICTLVPMRSVPHRVVCLLGLDDGAFPRHVERDGDDLIAADPHIGDRDARSEDRQLLLDALMAATDHLVITYSGRDERTNLVRPPAVPVGELLDVIDRTVVPSAETGHRRARQRIVVHHPLQPFDARNFTPGALVPGRPWSFDAVNLRGAQASLAERTPPRRFLAGPLPDLDTTTVELEQLERFVRHPMRAFLRQRFGISLGDWSNELDDALPVDLNRLARWGVGDRLLAAHLAGADLDACVAAERARGLLPPGDLATSTIDEVVPVVTQLFAAAAAALAATAPATAPAAATAGAAEDVAPAEPTSLDVRLDLAGGTSLVGTVAGVRGDLVLTVNYARLGPAHRLLSWVRLLALSASRPERPFHALAIGRTGPGASGGGAGGRGAGDSHGDGGDDDRVTVSIAHLPPLGDDPATRRAVALGHLEALVDLYRRGMREPPPLFRDTSAAWAAAAHHGRDPAKAASAQWTSAWNFDREDRQAEHLLVFGGELSFEELLATTGGPGGDGGDGRDSEDGKEGEDGKAGEDGAGWDTTELTAFGRYARRLWDGLLAHEQLRDA